jgi:hypothetical protein
MLVSSSKHSGGKGMASHNLPFAQSWEQKQLTGDNVKVDRAEFSSLSWTALLHSSTNA